MGVKIARLICILLIVAVIGFYCYEVFVMGTPYSENLIRALCVICAAVAAILRTGRGSRRRKSLKFYENAYREHIQTAFKDDAPARKKLLEGYRAYDEDKLKKVLRTAEKLKERCLNNTDREAVYLLAALAYTEMHLPEKAISEYEQLLARGVISATIYSNLGQQYALCGDRDKALDNYEAAVNTDPGYAVGYNNIAQLYFREGELYAAQERAEAALAADKNCHQAASLLAIVHAIWDNKAESERYAHMAAAAGQNPATLKNAIAHYKSVYTED